METAHMPHIAFSFIYQLLENMNVLFISVCRNSFVTPSYETRSLCTVVGKLAKKGVEKEVGKVVGKVIGKVHGKVAGKWDGKVDRKVVGKIVGKRVEK